MVRFGIVEVTCQRSSDSGHLDSALHSFRLRQNEWIMLPPNAIMHVFFRTEAMVNTGCLH